MPEEETSPAWHGARRAPARVVMRGRCVCPVVRATARPKARRPPAGVRGGRSQGEMLLGRPPPLAPCLNPLVRGSTSGASTNVFFAVVRAWSSRKG